jgi:predicted DNA-binding transcriptional regulator AlpA
LGRKVIRSATDIGDGHLAMTETTETFFGIPELRKRWGCSHVFIYDRLKDDPAFPQPVYFGRRPKFKLSAIEAYEKVLATRPKPMKRTTAAA